MTILTVAELRAYLGIETSTTFTADPATDNCTLVSVPFATESISTGTPVTLTSSVAVPDLPAPLVEDTTYYVILVADQVIQLATSTANAEAGTDIDITDAGTGTHTITLSRNDDDLLQGAIEAAQSYIESQTHRLFESTAGTRYYQRDALDPWDNTKLHLDEDCLTVTELLNADASATEITAANYWLLDRNLGPPYHWIKLLSDTGIYWEFDPDMWVEVTGTWGYSATPPGDIVEACMVGAAYFYKQASAQVFDTTAIPEAGVITIPQGIPATVTRVIERYKRYI